MIIDIISIFPKMFSPVLGESMIKNAQKKGLIKINLHDLRDYADLPHKKVDAPTFGGGPGMVMRCEPIFKAVESILGSKQYKSAKNPKKDVVFFTPQGKILSQKGIKKFLEKERLILLTGRYEGIDERIRTELVDHEVSLGDYVLSGGELAAMVFVDVLTRLIPGVVSCQDSIKRESFENNLLDYPHYTKPRQFRNLEVPKVLLSGNHEKIEEWRKKQAILTTKKKRPDLFGKMK